MATVEEHAIEIHNGAANGTTVAAPTGTEIPVENPATGEIITTVPDLDAAAVAELAKRGRLAQPTGRRTASRVAGACCGGCRSG